MQPSRSENFPLVIIIAIVALSYALHTVFDIFFEEWIKSQLEDHFGLTGAEMIERFGSLIVPGCFAIAVIWFIYLYIKRDFAAELAELKTPKLKCSFRMEDGGCVRPNSVIEFLAPRNGVMIKNRIGCDYYRVRVDSDLVSVHNTSGHLVSLKRDGEYLFNGENLPLTFAPAEHPDTMAKTIKNGLQEYLDLCAVTEDDNIILTTKNFAGPSSIPFVELFSKNGKYTFKVIVSSPDTAASWIDIDLEWSGQRTTAKFKSH